MKTNKQFDTRTMKNKTNIFEITQMSNESITFITQSQKKTFIDIMYLKTKTFSTKNIIDKRSFSKKFDDQMKFSIQRRRNANAKQMRSFQTQNINVFEILKNRTSFRSRKDKFSLNLNVTFIKNTQKNELWMNYVHFRFYNTTSKMKKQKSWFRCWRIQKLKIMICWRFKNRDATHVYRRRTIRSTSIFIWHIKQMKTCEHAFTSTKN
jgi:hypothetical protein